MSEMVDLVAQALCEADGRSKNYVGPGRDPNFPEWMNYRRKAQKAIAAMREPTEAMFRAVYAARPYGDCGGREQRNTDDEWRCMIDEALK